MHYYMLFHVHVHKQLCPKQYLDYSSNNQFQKFKKSSNEIPNSGPVTRVHMMMMMMMGIQFEVSIGTFPQNKIVSLRSSNRRLTSTWQLRNGPKDYHFVRIRFYCQKWFSSRSQRLLPTLGRNLKTHLPIHVEPKPDQVSNFIAECAHFSLHMYTTGEGRNKCRLRLFPNFMASAICFQVMIQVWYVCTQYYKTSGNKKNIKQIATRRIDIIT